MKKYIPLIVFTLNIAYLVIMVMSLITEIEPELLNLIYGLMLGALFFLFTLKSIDKPKKKKKLKAKKCNCTDPNDCEKWCNAKKLFVKANSYKVSEECKHPTRLTRVLGIFGTCEVTCEECADCEERLTDAKTDCV